MQVWGHLNGRRAPAFALFGRNTAYIEYDLLMSIMGRYQWYPAWPTTHA